MTSSRESTDEFLARLRALSITLRFTEGHLRVVAPKNALTPELREELASRKTEILAFLGDNARSLRHEPASIPRISRSGTLPLSSAQSRIWFLDQLNPDSTAYIFPMFARVRGQLHIGILKDALSGVVRRHEILRSIFPAQEGVPSQVILAPAEIELPLVELSNLASAEREAAALRIAKAEAQKPFDLTQGPLLRARLLHLDTNDHVLLLSVHHIVFDGSSTEVFWQDLASIYRAYCDEEPFPLSDLPVQYVDFASWQKQSLDEATYASHLAYWKRQLGDHPPALDLPVDRLRQYGNFPGAKKTSSLGSTLSAALNSLSRREGASLSMTLLAAFSVLLHRLTAQDDILVGMPTVRRNRPEFEKMIGMFVNTIVVHTRCPNPVTFLDVLAQVRDAMLDGHEHQDFPFEDLVGALNPQRDLTRSPLFQVFFNHLNMGLTPVNIPGLQIEPFGEFEVESKFDLTIYVQEQAGTISLMLVYNTQLFDDSRMAVLLEQYAVLLEQICKNPKLLVGDFSLVTKPDSGPALPNPTLPLEDRWLGPVHSGFLKWAATTPERIAVVDQDGVWSYGELDVWTAKVAQWLRARAVRPGDTVAIYAHRSAPLVMAILGILRAGAAFCILDPTYPALRLAKCVRAAQPKAWLEIAAAGAPPEALEAAILETAGERRLTLSRTPEAALADVVVDASEINDDDRAAYITFTSGTMGEPKCILGTHKPLSHFLDWHVHCFGLTDSDKFSMMSGLAHDPLLRDIFTPLWIGATLSIPDPANILSAGWLAQWMEDQKITVAHLTPAMGALLTQGSGNATEGPKALSALRYAFFGGDTLTSCDVARFSRLAPHAACHSFYGSTETPQAMAWCQADGTRSLDTDETTLTRIPIGSPIGDVQLLVLNAGGGLAGVGELGEIHVRTPYLSERYANDEELTRQRFLINPFTGRTNDRLYRTGDLARYRPDGLVDFAGRADQQVKIRGFRVELGEVEAALSSHPAIHDCAVFTPEDTSGAKKLVACIVERQPGAAHTDALRAHLAKVLPDYLIPSEFRILESMPLTPNGKIDRRALASGNLGVSSSSSRFTLPRNQLETTMADIWSRVLGVDKVGVFDSLFEMGGNSLAAVRLLAQIRTTLNIDLPLQALFLEPTIAGLAGHLRYDATTRTYQYLSTIPSSKCLVSMQPKGTRTPFFFVAGYTNPDDALLMLARFAPHMGTDQPVFGFRPRWIDGHGEAYSSVNEAADEFLAELRAVQPSGPYALGGYCVGGVIALEMARQLIQSGEKVSLLALLDCERPTAYRALLADIRLSFRRVIHMGDVIRGILIPNGRSRIEMIRELARRKTANAGPREAEASAEYRFYKNVIAYRRLGYSHRVAEYPGNIMLLVNDRQSCFDRYMGWKNVARGGLDVHTVRGDHLTVLTVYGRQFGELLRKSLDEVLQQQRGEIAV